MILKVISEEHATESTHTSASSPPERGLFRELNNCDPEARNNKEHYHMGMGAEALRWPIHR